MTHIRNRDALPNLDELNKTYEPKLEASLRYPNHKFPICHTINDLVMYLNELPGTAKVFVSNSNCGLMPVVVVPYLTDDETQIDFVVLEQEKD